MAFRYDGFSRSLCWTGHFAGLSKKFLQLFLQFKFGCSSSLQSKWLERFVKRNHHAGQNSVLVSKWAAPIKEFVCLFVFIFNFDSFLLRPKRVRSCPANVPAYNSNKGTLHCISRINLLKNSAERLSCWLLRKVRTVCLIYEPMTRVSEFMVKRKCLLDMGMSFCFKISKYCRGPQMIAKLDFF